MAIPELMRIFVDIEDLTWEKVSIGSNQQIKPGSYFLWMLRAKRISLRHKSAYRLLRQQKNSPRMKYEPSFSLEWLLQTWYSLYFSLISTFFLPLGKNEKSVIK